MPPPFFFLVLLSVSGVFTTFYSIFARCCAFRFLGFSSCFITAFSVCACKGNAWLALAMLRQSRCRIEQILCLIRLLAYSCAIAYHHNFVYIFFAVCFFYAIFAAPCVLHFPCACHVVLTWGGVRDGQLDSY